jgi:hypothetical protein
MPKQMFADIKKMAKLSTPSLGITVMRVDAPYAAIVEFFQLPLSGSPPGSALRRRREPSVSTFNSLSRDHVQWKRINFCLGQVDLSTPSLGITFVSFGINQEKEKPFNSLSRDHRARFRDFSALRGFLPRHLFAQMIPKTTIWIYRSAPL